MDEKYAIDKLAAAYLYERFYKEKRKDIQVGIAETLGLKQPMVSELLAEARKDGRLELRFIRDGLASDVMQKIEQRALGKEIKLKTALVKLNKRFKEATILDCSNSEARKKREEFGRQAAKLVWDKISLASTIGVTLGRTLEYLVDGMTTNVPARMDNLTFIPLSGESLGCHAQAQSSSVLASRLNQTVRTVTHADENALDPLGAHETSLRAVPAYIPFDLFKNKKEMEVLFRNYLATIAGYRSIFGPTKEGQAKPYAEELDVILTSVGIRGGVLGEWMIELTKATGLAKGDLSDLFDGNIGGVFIGSDRKPGKERADKRRRLGEAWTGLRLEHLENCAMRAANSNAKKGECGVVVLAVGKEKAEITLRCVKLGLVNELIIDTELAEHLLDDLSSREEN